MSTFDLSVLNPYIEEPNENDNHMAEIVIEAIGFDRWFKDHMDVWCNCSFISINGNRIIQTNDKRYNYEITTIICMIEKYGGENKDYYYLNLLNCHSNNLDFEAANGFAYDPYAIKGSKSPVKKRKTKQTTLDFGDKPKKETAAERKLKAHVAKISGLKINLKPANNGN